MNGLGTTPRACALIGVLALAPAAYSQHLGGQRADQSTQSATVDAAEKEVLAESIVARQERAGRTLNRAFRARLKSELASLPLERLRAIGSQPAGLRPGPKVLGGDSSANLVYTPVAPCRIVDTRVVTGPIAAGTQRNFFSAVEDYSGQGGSATGCGIPFGPSTAVVINVVAVNPAGAGNLRAYPWGGMLPAASVINYAKVNDLTSGGPLNVANAIVLPTCDPSFVSCDYDFVVQADVSTTHVVVDVLGFFRKVDSTMTSYVGAGAGILAGDNFLYPSAGLYIPPQDQKCLVSQTLAVDLALPYTTGGSFTQVALETNGLSDAIELGMYLFTNPTKTSGSASAVVSLTEGGAYRFGCYVGANGDLISPSSGWFCTVVVHCQ